MFERGTVRVMQVLIVLVVVATGWFVFRLRGIKPDAFGAGVDLKKSMETYQQRMRATERMLVNNRM